MNLAAGLVLALLAALALNVGFFVQHGAANTMVTLSVRHPFVAAKVLVTNRQWMLGYGAGWVGWGLYIAALALAPLSLVQSVSAGGVGILAVLAHRLGTPLTRQERIGTCIAVGGCWLSPMAMELKEAVAKRVAFTSFVTDTLVPHAEGAQKGIAGDFIKGGADLIKAMTDAGIAIWREFRSGGEARRKEIRQELESLRWPHFTVSSGK